jgi:hypothetical protein
MSRLTVGKFVTLTINITVFRDVMPVVLWWIGTTNTPQKTRCTYLNVFTIHTVAEGYFEVLVRACIYKM